MSSSDVFGGGEVFERSEESCCGEAGELGGGFGLGFACWLRWRCLGLGLVCLVGFPLVCFCWFFLVGWGVGLVESIPTLNHPGLLKS